MKSLTVTSTLLAMACAASAAVAGPSEGQWELDFLSNPALAPHGVFHRGSAGQIADLGSLNAGLLGNSGVAVLNRMHFSDALRTGLGVSAEAGYAVTSDLVPYVQLHYADLRGQNVAMGSISSPGLSSPADISANFGDWRSVALNVGARYYVSDYGRMRPYFEGYVGANRSGSLYASVASNALQATAGSNELLPPATRFDAGLASGVSLDVAPNADIRFQVGADYIAGQHAMSAAFTQFGVGPIAVGDHSWDLNAALGAALHF